MEHLGYTIVTLVLSYNHIHINIYIYTIWDFVGPSCDYRFQLEGSNAAAPPAKKASNGMMGLVNSKAFKLVTLLIYER